MNEVVVAPIELEEARHESLGGDPLIKRNLALLGHVNVRLEVLVGGAELTVEKLFSLSKGDAIALDAHMDAPVTVQLDGKPVARGHLLAVGDQFGVKISEIL
ncbi:FliM/FliN family flagellar motor switch protein [Dyella tabacisoli]|uniref:Flagellar motor switch protein FliN n=1 Tax=Dyella tabacisoli TaxID=2282381 RepID=A0A369UM62_9GAMM|nr:FliM/FliN family flagellar motor switch protein [Dyella tabacisoli]RDD81433.1 flagellar motor switch protein FliN [Dyella tabacisoli]